jgi:phosphoribosyl-ATP pyrophosphohydrolase/phosphoribosyl-AMP cyclohydrolase/histidinol dehydrogenase
MSSMRRIPARELSRHLVPAVSAETLERARPIVDAVRDGGDEALRALGEKFGDIAKNGTLIFSREMLAEAFHALPAPDQALLVRIGARIRRFAEAQRAAIQPLSIAVPGGRAGHVVAPVERAGCYAPGGRFPLPSSVLMTAITARAAGVASVWVASPRPAPITLAAAHVAGADALLAIGGAQAISALAFGTASVPRCDVIVGPGNRWVTAAKKLVAGEVRIDMLAGPSELVVLADAQADPSTLAADLLAQAEHDPDAVPFLVTTDAGLGDRVEAEISRQLETLPTAETARAALGNGGIVLARDLDEAISACDLLAPEHLEVMTATPAEVAPRLKHYGGLFIGRMAAEVLGDYGVGPNHVLPTGGTARHSGGLSVFDFLRIRTWLELDALPGDLIDDCARLARHEGLEAHARAAEIRRDGTR